MHKSTSSSNSKFSYSQKSVSVATLSLHPFLEMIGYDSTSEFFMNHLKHFNHFELPVVTDDGFVISNPQYFLAALEVGKAKIKVTVIHGANENDVVRFVSFKNMWKHGENRAMLIKVEKFLTNFLKNTSEGKEWAESIPGSKTREKIASILGVSAISVHNLRKLAKAGSKKAEEIDKGESTQKSVIGYQKPFIRRCEKYDNLEINNETVEGEECIIEELQFKVKNHGIFRIVLSDLGTHMFYNGKPVDSVASCSIGQPEQFKVDNGVRKKSMVGYEHVAVVPGKGQFGIHFSIRSIEDFMKEIKKAA